MLQPVKVVVLHNGSRHTIPRNVHAHATNNTSASLPLPPTPTPIALAARLSPDQLVVRSVWNTCSCGCCRACCCVRVCGFAHPPHTMAASASAASSFLQLQPYAPPAWARGLKLVVRLVVCVCVLFLFSRSSDTTHLQHKPKNSPHTATDLACCPHPFTGVCV